jgi:DNA-binding transcriptional LysR family regulator
MFDLFRLRLLSELARRSTMTAVASAFHMTSSAVSQQLATLEREAGVPLLERVGRGVRFTPEGARLSSHAHDIVALVAAAADDLRPPDRRGAGTLDVACFSTYASAHLVPAIARMRRRAPRIAVAVHEVEPVDAIEALRRGSYHVAIAFEYDLMPRATPADLQRIALLDEPVHLALPAAWKGTPARRPFDLARLDASDWIVGSRQRDDRLMAERACAARGFAPRITHTVDDYALLLAMVAAGLGVGLVPELALRARSAGVVIRRPDGRALRRHVHAVVRRGLAASSLVRALVDELLSARAR